MCGKLPPAQPPRTGSTHDGGGRTMLRCYPPLCTHRHLGPAVWSSPHQPHACTQRVPALHSYKQSYGNPPLATNMGGPNPLGPGMGPACSAFRVQANDRDAYAAGRRVHAASPWWSENTIAPCTASATTSPAPEVPPQQSWCTGSQTTPYGTKTDAQTGGFPRNFSQRDTPPPGAMTLHFYAAWLQSLEHRPPNIPPVFACMCDRQAKQCKRPGLVQLSSV